MSDKIDWELLARYMTGECSKKEQEKIDEWSDSDQENLKLLKSLELMWRTPEILPQVSDIKQLWLETAKRAKITSRPEPLEAKRFPDFFLFHKYQFLRYAVILVMAVGLSFMVWKISNIFSHSQQDFELTRIEVPYGEKSVLYLSDSTKVTLDAGSVFQYPEEFKGNTREVYLSGEGYFEVTKNTKNPFIVHANNAAIKVLGTLFDVRAWAQTKIVEVVVIEGRVSLQTEKSNIEEVIVISKGQLSILPEEGQPTEPRPVDVEKRISWITNEAFFYDVPLREILDQLERWYDLRIILKDESLASEHLTIHLENRPINDIMELISTLSGLKYEQKNSTIILQLNTKK